MPRRNLNLPNIITATRVFLIPFIVIFLQNPGKSTSLIAAFLFLLAALSDFLDGYFARKNGQITPLGKLIDPLADKILVISVMIMLVEIDRLSGWIVVVIVFRELAVTGLRNVLTLENIVLPADMTGKVKTVFQIIALTMLIVHYEISGIDFQTIGTVFIWIAMLLTVYSGMNYFRFYFKQPR